MKLFKQAMKYGSAPLALIVGGAANAAVPADVTTAITSAGTDLVTVATALIVALVAFWGIKAIGKKFGWWA